MAAKALLVILMVLLALMVATRLDLRAVLTTFLLSLQALGPWAAVLYVAAYIAACVLLIPGTLLTLGGGAVFGFWWGLLWTALGAGLGALAAFLAGRYAARRRVAAWIERSPRLGAVDQMLEREGWWVVFLLRLSPAVPFNILNYLCGISKVSTRDYITASFLGMLPGMLVFVYAGSLMADLAALGKGGRPRTPLEWGLTGVGLIATLLVAIYLARLASKALPPLHPRQHSADC